MEGEVSLCIWLIWLIFNCQKGRHGYAILVSCIRHWSTKWSTSSCIFVCCKLMVCVPVVNNLSLEKEMSLLLQHAKKRALCCVIFSNMIPFILFVWMIELFPICVGNAITIYNVSNLR